MQGTSGEPKSTFARSTSRRKAISSVEFIVRFHTGLGTTASRERPCHPDDCPSCVSALVIFVFQIFL